MKNVAVVIPAHNEEKVIRATIRSVAALVGRDNVYIVDDGSKDKTSKIAKRFTDNVLVLSENQGKARALNATIKHFRLTNRYKYIMPIDADCVVGKDYFVHAFAILDGDIGKRIACVVGKVVGRNSKWITTYRLWEYEINQLIHKSAQSLIGGITVCPGPSTIYRASIFEKLKYSEDTRTEDMDFTFLLHRRKVGKIIYEPKCRVYTQDPGNLSSYIKQVKRWYTGFWQCIAKHHIPWGAQVLDFEAALLATDGVLNSLLAIYYVFLFPMFLLDKSKFFVLPVAIDLLFFMIPATIYVGVKEKSVKILGYLPHFYFMRFLGSFVFLYSFLKFSIEVNLKYAKVWDTARYEIKKEELWVS